LTVARASDDEDVQADYGNDLVRLHMVQDLEREAVGAFGPLSITLKSLKRL
jgi:hypothetical protein